MPSAVPPLPKEALYEALRIPPAETQFGAKVEHLTISTTQNMVDALVEQLQIPQDIIRELMRFGAVYYCNVVPLPGGKYGSTLAPEELDRITQAHTLGVATWGRNPHHHQPRRVFTDQVVTAGGYVRVHLQPKRFPAAYKVDWSTRVLHDGAEFVVVNKPPGVQVPPTSDNVLESVVAKVEQELRMERDTLLTTHRLDAGTEGVLVLAKTSAFARYFQELLRDKQDSVRKLYRCLASGRPPLGHVVHWASVRQRSKGEPPHTVVHTELPEGGEEAAGLRRCELIVRQVEEVQLTGDARQQWGERAFEVTVELITGRTHQIRAQLAALGCPLLGDALYSALLRAKQLEAARAGSEAAVSGDATGCAQQQGCSAPAEPAPRAGAVEGGRPAAADGPAATGRAPAGTSSCNDAAGEPGPGGSGAAAEMPAHVGGQQGDDRGNGEAAAPRSSAGGGGAGDCTPVAPGAGAAAAAAAAEPNSTATGSSNKSSRPTAGGGTGRNGSSGGRGAAELEAGEPRLRTGVASGATGEWQWQDELRQDPLRPIALQAFRLEVLEAGLMGDTPPVVFEAGIPWWRSGA